MDTLNVEQQCAILQTVAQQYPATASEYQSIELGASTTCSLAGLDGDLRL